MIAELAARVFAARDIAHRRHWETKSHAEHIALNSFYDDVIEAVDAVVENYQGMFGPIGPFDVKTTPVKDISAFLQEDCDWIESHRDEISQGSASIGALVDTLVSVYSKVLFMLRLK